MLSDENTPAFSASLRGYNRREVDEYIESMREKAVHQTTALQEAEKRLNELAADPAVPLEILSPGTIGTRIERIVAMAEAEAREIREQAVDDVAQLRAEFEQEADQARRFREQASKASAEEARRLVTRAEDEVAKLRQTRADLLDQLVKIGDTVDLVTERLAEKKRDAPQPRAATADATTPPLTDAKERLRKAAAG